MAALLEVIVVGLNNRIDLLKTSIDASTAKIKASREALCIKMDELIEATKHYNDDNIITN